MFVSSQVNRTHHLPHEEQDIVVSGWWKYGEHDSWFHYTTLCYHIYVRYGFRFFSYL
jgi:hypothetical protein